MTLADHDSFRAVSSGRSHRPIWRYVMPWHLFEWLRDRQRKRRTLVQLSELADWQLDDIGLERSEVERILAEEGIHRDPAQLFDTHR